MNKFQCVAVALFLSLSSQGSDASSVDFFSPDSVTSTNTDQPVASVLVTNLIDGSGLSAAPVTLDNIGTVFHSNAVATDLWRGSSNAMPITITFNFDIAQALGYVGLWQSFDNREGVGAFTLSFFDEANGAGNQVGGAFAGILDDVNGGPNSISLAGRAFDVGTRAGVRSVTMEITSIAVPGNPFVHMGEFMVAPAAVPVPPALLMLTSGLAALGFSRRRKY